jgi:uncharacterized protein (DUF885 family)
MICNLPCGPLRKDRAARALILCCLALVLWGGKIAAEEVPRAGDERLYGLIRADWEYLKQHAPAVAQFAGDWRYMNSWPDLSSSSIRALRKYDRDRLAELRNITSKSLSETARLDYRLFERELLNREKKYTARAYLTHFWQFDRFGPSALRLLTFVASEPPPTEAQHFRARVHRLNTFNRYVDQQIELMREAGRRNVAPPAILVTAAIRSLEAELNLPPEKSAFYRSFTAAAGIPDAAVQLEAARQAIRAVVKPALRRLVTFLSSDYLKLCPTAVSLSKWSHGSALYSLLVDLSTTATLPPEEIHKTGLSEVARIRAEMQAAVRATGYSGPVEGFVASVRGDKRFYFATEEELVAAYRSTAHRAAGQVSRLFRSVPTFHSRLRPGGLVRQDRAPLTRAVARYW